MGGHMSSRMGKKGLEEAELEGISKYAVELSDYEEVCKTDLDVKKFDDALQARTERVINALADGELSLHSLKEVTSCFLDIDQNVAKLILENKKDIWNTPDLFELVQEYFDNSLETLNFYTVLENCLRRARDNQLLIQIALQHIAPASPPPGEAQYRKLVEDLGNFKTAGNPFSDHFLPHFQAVYRRHFQMLEKLHAKKSKLDKKLKNVRAWRKFSSIIFVATFATVLICSVVAAAVAAPPLAAALAAAKSIPIITMGKWVNSLWKKYEDTMERQRAVINAMDVGTFVALKDLETIRVLVERVESSISSILSSVEFCLKDADAVQIAAEDIRRKQQNFTDEIEDLFDNMNRCSLVIREARTRVALKIMNPSKKRSFSL